MRVFHGTSTAIHFKQFKVGTYFSSDVDIAISFARDKVAEIGGKPIVYEAEINICKIIDEYPLRYEADSWFNHEMGYRYYVNNVPISIKNISWKEK